MSQARQLRRRFYRELQTLLPLVWPVFSLLIGLMVSLGLLIGHLEGWKFFEGIYFAFVTGLTVGYGDLVPKLTTSRVVAIAMRALHAALLEKAASPADPERTP